VQGTFFFGSATFLRRSDDARRVCADIKGADCSTQPDQPPVRVQARVQERQKEKERERDAMHRRVASRSPSVHQSLTHASERVSAASERERASFRAFTFLFLSFSSFPTATDSKPVLAGSRRFGSPKFVTEIC